MDQGWFDGSSLVFQGSQDQRYNVRYHTLNELFQILPCAIDLLIQSQRPAKDLNEQVGPARLPGCIQRKIASQRIDVETEHTGRGYARFVEFHKLGAELNRVWVLICEVDEVAEKIVRFWDGDGELAPGVRLWNEIWSD